MHHSMYVCKHLRDAYMYKLYSTISPLLNVGRRLPGVIVQCHGQFWIVFWFAHGSAAVDDDVAQCPVVQIPRATWDSGHR